ncbi:MAG: tetratricopeptide (TPR) repeat protein [Rhodothermales bacterium]
MSAQRFSDMRSVFALLFLLLTIPATAQSHRALITEISGAVTVTRANGSAAGASWGLQLFDGDMVTTGSGAKAALLYSNGSLLSMAANAEALVAGAGGSASSVDPTLMADVSDMTLHRTGDGEIAALGGLRSGGSEADIDLQYPRQTRTLSPLPVFAWETWGEFEQYTVTVLSDDGVVWSGTTTTETSLAYPESAPVLDPAQTYYWRVEGEDMLDVVKSELIQFQTLSADDAVRIEAAVGNIRSTLGDDAESADYVVGSMYAKEGLNAEAIALFEGIAVRHADSAMVHEILGKLYYETGRKDLAVESLQKALALSKGQ